MAARDAAVANVDALASAPAVPVAPAEAPPDRYCAHCGDYRVDCPCEVCGRFTRPA